MKTGIHNGRIPAAGSASMSRKTGKEVRYVDFWTKSLNTLSMKYEVWRLEYTMEEYQLQDLPLWAGRLGGWWRREGRECPRGNELVFTRPTRPTSRQTKKQLTTIQTRRKDQHDHLRCLPTNTTNVKKNYEAARPTTNEPHANANFETDDNHPMRCKLDIALVSGGWIAVNGFLSA